MKSLIFINFDHFADCGHNVIWLAAKSWAAIDCEFKRSRQKNILARVAVILMILFFFNLLGTSYGARKQNLDEF